MAKNFTVKNPMKVITGEDTRWSFANVWEPKSIKAPGKKPRPLQLSRHRLLRELGYRVYVIDDPKQIGGMIDELQST